MRIGRQISPEGYNRLRIDRWQLDVLQGAEQFIRINSIFTASAITDILTIDSDEEQFTTGESVMVSQAGVLPTPLIINTVYYVIRIGAGSIKLATKPANATAGIAIDLLTDGTPINRINLVTVLTADIQPVVFFSYSKDGGQTYGNKLRGTMGRIGERTHRTVWRKLGTTPRGQGFVPKIEFFNEIPFVVLGASWDFEVLPE
jgi:hypothetical protein